MCIHIYKINCFICWKSPFVMKIKKKEKRKLKAKRNSTTVVGGKKTINYLLFLFTRMNMK